MAEEYLIWDLLNIENRVRQVRRREEKRAWRDINDSFELHNDVFTNLFRLLSDTVLELLDTLRPRLRRLRPWDFTRTTDESLIEETHTKLVLFRATTHAYTVERVWSQRILRE
ncbi:uncharacterized protein LOC105191406 isoform X2 [Harpegnathos saltator]|uniref:uncharacterized protein LOC105191406 isoform X2 n=1 Tax=Harpegnathos saltator TaxID=610380 RepID=UPI00058B9EAB|nr:uncharacterized protein LOC105191406 isoform X2 [Harpegnathos saltator]